VTELVALATGAELRLTNGPRGGRSDVAILCLNGGQSREVAGTWSATLEWLVQRLAPVFPAFCFAEVRYRVKSWRQLDSCIEDARAAIAATGASRLLALGFSMGGAVAISVADEPGIERVLGLAPWIPDELGLDTLRGRRLDVLHGSLDRYLPGIPGVTATASRRGFERARALGVAGSYTLIRGGVHGVALRVPGGGMLPLPRAHTWLRLVSAQLSTLTT
jgi:pimeloyl-ACP methyl ester carboxylesterase